MNLSRVTHEFIRRQSRRRIVTIIGGVMAVSLAIMAVELFVICLKCESKGENKMSNQFEFEPAYYLASVTQYVSDDGRHYIVGPIWECAKKIDGEEHFPVVVARKGMEGCVYWCREKSRGSSGNFEMESQHGDFRLADNSFCHSDETAPAIYAEFVSGGTTNKVALERKDMDSIDYPELPMSETRKD